MMRISLLIGWLCSSVWGAVPEVPTVLIDGRPLSPASWKFLCLTRGVDDKTSSADLERLTAQAVDRELIRRSLTPQQWDAAAELNQRRLDELLALIERRGTTPEQLFSQLGLTQADVEQELRLSTAWELWVTAQVTSADLRRVFEQRRREYDGSRLHVRQIFRKATSSAEVQTAQVLLQRVREELSTGKTRFADACVKWSEAPSKAQGGDVGWIVGRGQLQETVTDFIMQAPAGTLSEPIVSPLGVHLVEVLAIEPGQLSVEDARPQLLERIAGERWTATVEKLRSTSRISPR